MVGVQPTGAAPAAGPMGLTGYALYVAQFCAFFGFCSLNIGLNFYNSWLLRSHEIEVHEGNVTRTEKATYPVNGNPNFDFPVFYTMWHMVASVIGASIIMATVAKPKTGFPNLKQFTAYMWPLLLISFCSAVNISTNNISLTLISLFLNQVIKATGPLPTMVFSFLLEGRTYSWGMLISCGLIVAGTILAVPFSSSGPQTSVAGVVVVIISTIFACLKPVIMSIVMKGTPDRPKLEPTVVLFYDTFLAFWFMLVYWLVSHERQGVIDYYKGGNGGLATGLVTAGALMAFGFNLSNYFVVLLTSALTVTVCGNAVKVLNIVISAFITGLSDARNWCGVALVCVSLVVYAYFSHQDRGRPKSAVKLPFTKKSDMESGKVSEGTPLKGEAVEEAPGACGACVIC